MPRRRSRRSRNSPRRAKQDTAGPPAAAIQYRGAVVPSIIRTDDYMTMRRLTAVVSWTTTAGGLFNIIFTNNPNTGANGAAFQDWSSLVGLFQEYRVLAMRCTTTPNWPAWGTTAALAFSTTPYYLYPVRNASLTPVTSASAAWSIDGARAASVERPLSISLRMKNVAEAGFTNVASTVSTFGIGIQMGGTNSTTYGLVHLELLVQFRGTL